MATIEVAGTAFGYGLSSEMTARAGDSGSAAGWARGMTAREPGDTTNLSGYGGRPG